MHCKSVNALEDVCFKFSVRESWKFYSFFFFEVLAFARNKELFWIVVYHLVMSFILTATFTPVFR